MQNEGEREEKKLKTNLLINDGDAASQSLILLIYAINTPRISHTLYGKSSKRIEKQQKS